MDWTTFVESMQATVGDSLPVILGALAILVIGWFVAIVLRAIVRRAVGFMSLNNLIERVSGSKLDFESGISAGVYYLVLLMVLIAFFNVLNLQLVSQPLQALVDQVFAYAPRLVAGGLIILVAVLLATVLRRVATKALEATGLDQKVGGPPEGRPFSKNLGTALYWLVILLFLPGILGTLGLQGLLQPVQGMFEKFLAMVPNIIAAAVIGLVGWFVARLLRDLVSNLLSAAGVDRAGEKAGLTGTMSLSRLIGMVVYIFTFVPALIAAMDALNIAVVSVPATQMLATFMAAIPNLFAAAVLLAVTFYVARFVGGLVARLLEGIGFDRIPQAIGIGGGERVALSAWAGKLIVFFAMIFAAVEASSMLGFDQMSQIVATFVQFGGQVLIGVAIIGVGLWLSNLAFGAIRSLGGTHSAFYGGLVRYAILGLVVAMGLRAMGIADDIVNLAFGLTLGSLAVAVALAFGLGGREAAGRQLEFWFSRLRGER